MKDKRRPLFLEESFHAIGIVHIYHQRNKLRRMRRRTHFPVDLVKRVLTALHHENARSARCAYLAHDLGSDRAAGAGDENGAACHVARRDGIVERIFVTLQKLRLLLARHPVDAPEASERNKPHSGKNKRNQNDGIRRTNVG